MSRRAPRVLVVEPANQQLPIDTARPNGALGPAYLVGALRDAGYEADYYDATVGRDDEPLAHSFFNRVEQPNGTVRYGASAAAMAEVFSGYDVIATSSIFTAQTRMHFEVADIVRRVSAQRDRRIYLFAGGVNARAMREQFLDRGFDAVSLGEGERTIVALVSETAGETPDYARAPGVASRRDGRTIATPVGPEGTVQRLDSLPAPALAALPLARYRDLGIPHAGVMPQGTTFAAIQTSRGCQDRCTFCHISTEKANVAELGTLGFLREFSADRVRDDVDRAVALGVRRLYFEDDNLFFSKRRLAALAPALARPGLEYSNVNGANLRFLFRREDGGFVVDREFITLLAAFGLRELVLPFESRNPDLLRKYATAKYDPDRMDSVALVRALSDAGIRTAGNFMIGFRDESWDSILRTKAFAHELRREGLDAVGFMIPVPYPGSLDFETVMLDPAARAAFQADPLAITDRMHWRARPLFPTRVPGERLEAAIRDFWLEINDARYTDRKQAQNVAGPQAGA